MAITVLIAKDTTEEEAAVVNNRCTYAVSDRGNEVYVSTKVESDSLSDIPGWRIVLHGGVNCLKRFQVKKTFGEVLSELKILYGENAVRILT